VTRVALVLTLLVLAAAGPAAAKCTDISGGRIVFLRSAELDPDVFVWDTRDRARDYAAGYWKNTSDVMNHSVLSKPGTRAIVVQCHEAAIRSKFANQVLDAVGIRIVSGPNHGMYGWVTSEDVHAYTKTADARGK
jgi:hypothetical protein